MYLEKRSKFLQIFNYWIVLRDASFYLNNFIHQLSWWLTIFLKTKMISIIRISFGNFWFILSINPKNLEPFQSFLLILPVIALFFQEGTLSRNGFTLFIMYFLIVCLYFFCQIDNTSTCISTCFFNNSLYICCNVAITQFSQFFIVELAMRSTLFLNKYLKEFFSCFKVSSAYLSCSF